VRSIRSSFFVFLTVSAILIFTTSSAFAENACEIQFSDAKIVGVSVETANLAKQIESGYDSQNARAYQSFQAVKAALPNLERGGLRLLIKSMKDVMQDEELSVFHQRLQVLFDGVQADISAGKIKSNGTPKEIATQTLASMQSHLSVELLKVMSAKDASLRVKLLTRPYISQFQMLRALGYMDVNETVASVVGDGGLVARYVKEAAANGKNVASLVATFATKPGGTDRSPARLFVSVDATTMSLANKIFSENPSLLIHNHSPSQGTLHLIHRGQDISYARYVGASPLSTQIGSMFPIIVLSTTEASRAQNYFDLGNLSGTQRSKYPWSLKQIKGEEQINYCRLGGYISCTHWFGEMPIGDVNVETYSFPGQPDTYAGQDDPAATNKKVIRTGPVGTYSHFTQSGADLTAIGSDLRLDRLTRMVWNQNAGHEQMWSMLNGKLQLSEEFLSYLLFALMLRFRSRKLKSTRFKHRFMLIDRF
jgi:hypothetical protein